MRIAWITPYIPWPENSGGRIRVAQLARALGSESLHLFAALGSGDEPETQRAAWEPWETVRIWSRSRPPSFLFSRLPYNVRSFPKELWRAVQAEHRENPWDAIIIEQCYSARDFEPIEGVVAILNEQNIESSYWLRELAVNPWSFVKARHLLRSWRRFERAIWVQVDHVTEVTDADARQVITSRPVSVFPNAVNIERFAFRPPTGRRGHDVLFVGLMSYEPNVDAALVLANDVMPLVWQQLPNATLTLAGREPAMAVRKLANDHVRVTGAIPEVETLFDSHAVYAMPVRLGGGSSLKTLQPLAAGLPLVASDFAVRGHGLESGRHYVRADNAEAMALAIIDVLTNAPRYDDMAVCARAIAEQHSWQHVGTAYAQWLQDIVGTRQSLRRVDQ